MTINCLQSFVKLLMAVCSLDVYYAMNTLFNYSHSHDHSWIISKKRWLEDDYSIDNLETVRLI